MGRVDQLPFLSHAGRPGTRLRKLDKNCTKNLLGRFKQFRGNLLTSFNCYMANWNLGVAAVSL